MNNKWDMSFLSPLPLLPRVSLWIQHTTIRSMSLLRENKKEAEVMAPLAYSLLSSPRIQCVPLGRMKRNTVSYHDETLSCIYRLFSLSVPVKLYHMFDHLLFPSTEVPLAVFILFHQRCCNAALFLIHFWACRFPTLNLEVRMKCSVEWLNLWFTVSLSIYISFIHVLPYIWLFLSPLNTILLVIFPYSC